MTSKLVRRWSCDFCHVSKFTRPAMEKHERGCTLNPNRVCKMCVLAGLKQKPMVELLAALRGTTWGIDACGEQTGEVQRDKELREAAGNCPACILATLRQTMEQEVGWFIDWKAESKAWLDWWRKPDEHAGSDY